MTTVARKIKLSKALRLLLEYQAVSRLIDLAFAVRKREIEKRIDYGKEE